jgi:hypothetical protein
VRTPMSAVAHTPRAIAIVLLALFLGMATLMNRAWFFSDSESEQREPAADSVKECVGKQSVNRWASSSDSEAAAPLADEDDFWTSLDGVAPILPDVDADLQTIGSDVEVFVSDLMERRSRSPRKLARLRSPSTDPGLARSNISSSLPEKTPPTLQPLPMYGAAWWFPSLWRILASFLDMALLPKRDMVHVSLYTGMASELSCLGGLNVRQTCISGCDCKLAAQQFACLNWKGHMQHFYTDVESSIDGRGVCRFHPGRICHSKVSVVDCLTSGSPCQAWAMNREKNKQGFRNCPIVDHPDWCHTFTHFFRFLDKNNVRGGWSEQTKGFDHKTSGVPEGFATPLLYFTHLLRQRGYCVSVLKNNNLDAWCELQRERRSSPGRKCFPAVLGCTTRTYTPLGPLPWPTSHLFI